eukprot:240324_1
MIINMQATIILEAFIIMSTLCPHHVQSCSADDEPPWYHCLPGSQSCNTYPYTWYCDDACGDLFELIVLDSDLPDYCTKPDIDSFLATTMATNDEMSEIFESIVEAGLDELAGANPVTSFGSSLLGPMWFPSQDDTAVWSDMYHDIVDFAQTCDDAQDVRAINLYYKTCDESFRMWMCESFSDPCNSGNAAAATTNPGAQIGSLEHTVGLGPDALWTKMVVVSDPDDCDNTHVGEGHWHTCYSYSMIYKLLPTYALALNVLQSISSVYLAMVYDYHGEVEVNEDPLTCEDYTMDLHRYVDCIQVLKDWIVNAENVIDARFRPTGYNDFNWVWDGGYHGIKVEWNQGNSVAGTGKAANCGSASYTYDLIVSQYNYWKSNTVGKLREETVALLDSVVSGHNTCIDCVNEVESFTVFSGTMNIISVGADGTVWGIMDSGALYRYSNGWSWVNNGPLIDVSVGSANNVWAVSAGGYAYQWTPVGLDVKGRAPNNVHFMKITASANGAVYALAVNGKLYTRSDNSWVLQTNNPGLEWDVISVSSHTASANYIWGLSGGRAYKIFESGAVQDNGLSQWDREYVDIDVGSDGFVVALDVLGQMWFWNSDANDFDRICVSRTFRSIRVGMLYPNRIYALDMVNPSDNIWRMSTVSELSSAIYGQQCIALYSRGHDQSGDKSSITFVDDGIDLMTIWRGHNIVIFDADYNVIDTASFDTHSLGVDADAADYLNAIPSVNRIVAIVAWDSADKDSEISDILIDWGCLSESVHLILRESFIYLGTPNSEILPWQKCEKSERYHDPIDYEVCLPIYSMIHPCIALYSSGYDQSGDESSITFAGDDLMTISRGHNIAILDATTFNVIDTATFDTHPSDAADVEGAAYLDAIPSDNRIVAIVTYIEAYRDWAIARKLEEWGCPFDTAELAYGESFIFIGTPNSEIPSWQKCEFSGRYEDPIAYEVCLFPTSTSSAHTVSNAFLEIEAPMHVPDNAHHVYDLIDGLSPWVIACGCLFALIISFSVAFLSCNNCKPCAYRTFRFEPVQASDSDEASAFDALKVVSESVAD